jgi:dTDP-glucose 4,6-dehydratase
LKQHLGDTELDTKPKRVLIIGGTRFVGASLTRRLINAGHSVTLFNRGNNYGSFAPSNVRHLFGDRTKSESLAPIKDEDFDIVYDMCCYSPSKALMLVEALSGAPHIVFFSSAAVYREPGIYPVSEDAPLGKWHTFGEYGPRKAAAEEVFSQYALDRGSKVTIFRPTYLLGQNNYFDRENYFFSRILKSKPVLIPGNGVALLQFGFEGDVTTAFETIPFTQTRQIETLNLGGYEFISLTNFVELCADIAGRQAHIVHLDTRQHGLHEDMFYDDLYPFPNVNFLISNSRVVKEYGQVFTPLRQGLETIYNDWILNWDGSVYHYEKESEILSSLSLG